MLFSFFDWSLLVFWCNLLTFCYVGNIKTSLMWLTLKKNLDKKKKNDDEYGPRQPWSSGLAPVSRFHSSVPLFPLVPRPYSPPWTLSSKDSLSHDGYSRLSVLLTAAKELGQQRNCTAQSWSHVFSLGTHWREHCLYSHLHSLMLSTAAETAIA